MSIEAKVYRFTLTGVTPFLSHADNISWSDAMEKWQREPGNAKMSKPGDDRTPAWRWIGGCVNDGEQIAIPSEYLSRCLMGAGAMLRTGKGQKTHKATTQSGMMIAEPFLPMKVNGAIVPWAKIMALKEDDDFDSHRAKVAAMGFELDYRRLRVGQSKHVRVRAMFTRWSCAGTIQVIDAQLTKDVVAQLFELAGRYRGLGDGRPCGPTPGPFGRFDAEVSLVK